MRRFLMLTLLFPLCAGSVQVAAQALTPADRTFFDQHISQLVTIQPRLLTAPAVLKVFSATFYDVTVAIHGSSGTETSKLIAARAGSRLLSVEPPGSDGSLPDVLALLNHSFTLATDADARVLQQALDVVYPISSMDDTKAEAFSHTGHAWTFVRGSFFGKHAGFVFDTAPDGTITSVSYSLKLP
ncbi:MAG TPA: hypothetical protein VNE16_12540 [Vicinamibacterales bacterium]|nr:hypothetical protein [Vicinamibacterales bacterium]